MADVSPDPAAERATLPPTEWAADPLEERTVALVRTWLERSADAPVDPAAARLAGVLRDPHGLPFTLGFVDGVVRPEDLRVAARNLRRLLPVVPRFLPAYQRAAIAAGALLGPALPWPVVPAARFVLRRMVGHLVLDATPARLGRRIAALRATGARLNINLLGEAVLGDGEAARRLQGTRRLLERDDVDYVSIKVSAIASQLSLWGFDETVDRVVGSLLPLYRYAARAGTRKFINLDMEEYKDLELTIAVFQRLLDTPDLLELEAGIVLQAYLPDALSAMQRLNRWSQQRRERGGAPIKVRVVKGANLLMERVDARLHDWELATLPSKEATDANYKRVLDWALTPGRTDAVHLGIAGHNLFDVAHAWLLANERGVADRVDFEMLLGMASGQAAAVREDVGGLLLYTPVVAPAEFDVAISYLVRRLEENSSDENFLSAAFDLQSDASLFERERTRFSRSLAAVDGSVPRPNRRQDRRSDRSLPRAGAPFANEPDTDPSLPGNVDWGRAILDRAVATQLGSDTVRAARLDSTDQLEQLLRRVAKAGATWGPRRARSARRCLTRRRPRSPRAGPTSSRWLPPRRGRPWARAIRRSARPSTSPPTTPTGRASSTTSPARPSFPRRSPWSRRRGTSPRRSPQGRSSRRSPRAAESSSSPPRRRAASERSSPRRCGPRASRRPCSPSWTSTRRRSVERSSSIRWSSACSSPARGRLPRSSGPGVPSSRCSPRPAGRTRSSSPRARISTSPLPTWSGPPSGTPVRSARRRAS
ncbi:hypothetical protein GCM10025866_13480 [Naasia aerilata]|uniref:Proline dehydrogenase domain-containing protein n=1 Tax=Naasia aerilata TaxID=1162966 RepID=A0ABN6XKH1_9MICO|nr:hypothetical protein GCM10025866_13480 [Naasia aerilata]